MLRILSWNVNGIRACAEKGFFNWIKEESPDILCLQETKASPEQLEDKIVHPKEYSTYWNSPLKKGYAGVSVFTKKKPAGVDTAFPVKGFDGEGRTLILKYKEFILMNVYFPNGGMSPERLAYKLRFYDKFLEFLKKAKNKNIILCGDVNTAHKEIDLARPKENEMFSGFLPEEREWLDRLVAAGFVDTFRHLNKDGGHYTWWDYKTRARERNVGWRIDYFFVHESLVKKLKSAFILPEVHGSDHCPVGIEIDAGA